MKNYVGELVKEKNTWQRSPRVRGRYLDPSLSRSKKSCYDLAIAAVHTNTAYFINGELCCGPMNSSTIDSVFKSVSSGVALNSWEDHIEWIEPEFTLLVLDTISYDKKNQVKFVKVLLPNNEEVWLHANDVEVV